MNIFDNMVKTTFKNVKNNSNDSDNRFASFFQESNEKRVVRNNTNQTLYCKLVLLGDTSVGKTSIVSRHVRGEFYEFQEPTIGAAFMTSRIQTESGDVKFEIWDTAGQERYRSLAPMYYRGAKCAFVVYDLTHKDSFIQAKSWIVELQKKGDKDILIFLLGNKNDMFTNTENIKKNKSLFVNIDEVESYVTENNFLSAFVSAKLGDGIDEAFKTLAIQYFEKEEQKRNKESENGFYIKDDYSITKKLTLNSANCC